MSYVRPLLCGMLEDARSKGFRTSELLWVFRMETFMDIRQEFPDALGYLDPDTGRPGTVMGLPYVIAYRQDEYDTIKTAMLVSRISS